VAVVDALEIVEVEIDDAAMIRLAAVLL